VNITHVLLPMIFVVGFFTSRSDVAAYRIKNKWIALGLCTAAVVYLTAWAVVWSGGPAAQAAAPLVWSFDRWCVNFAVSIVFAFLLWRRKMWGGGDAKLFICYVALTPLSVYPVVFFGYYFAAFFLLWCVFVPATLWFLVSLGFREVRSIVRRPGVFWTGLKEKARRLSPGRVFKDLGQTVWRLVVCILFFSLFRSTLAVILGPQAGMSPLVPPLVLISALVLLRGVTRNRLSLIVTTVALTGWCLLDRAAWARSLVRLKMSALMILGIVLAVILIQRFFDYEFEDKDDEKSFLAPWFLAGTLIVWILRALQAVGLFASP